MSFNRYFTPLDEDGNIVVGSDVTSVNVYSTGGTSNLITSNYSVSGGVLVIEFPDNTDEEVDIWINGYKVIENVAVSDAGIFAKTSDITFETLSANGDVGTGSSQVAQGDHTHSGTYVAVGDYEDSDVLTKIKNVDGTGSGLDADLLDGSHGSVFAKKSADADIDMNNYKISELKQATANGEYDNGNSGTSKTITWANGTYQKITLTGNCTLTFTAPAGPTHLQLKLIQDATGSRTITLPASCRGFDGGAALTLTTDANAVDILFLYYDGTNYHTSLGLNSKAFA